LGFTIVEKRGDEAILWKQYDRNAKLPHFRKENYYFKPIKGKIVINMFWNRFWLTSDVEVERVREEVLEYGKDVVLNEYSAIDQKVL
jgi:hypothetical protein